MEDMTGTEVLVKALRLAGVECAFIQEHPETVSLLEAAAAESGFKTITPVSETSCVPMADGYARFSGRPAAAVTAGGGHVLNQVIGVASAWADKSPVISIGVSGDQSLSPSPIFDRERWCPAEAFTAVTRWTAAVQEWDQIPDLVFRAARESLAARCGPVHLEVPRQILETRKELRRKLDDPASSSGQCAHLKAPPRGDPALVRQACELLARAERPLVVAGGGVIRADAVAEINDLARELVIPITSTMGGMGAALPDNPAFMGASSYLSGEAFHAAIRAADVVLAVGACFSGLDGFGLPPLWSERIKFIQVNLDPEDIGLNPPAEIAIVGDARQVLRQMLDVSRETGSRPAPSSRRAWLERLRRLNQEHLDRIADEAGRPWPLIHPAAATRALYEAAKESDVALVLDGGNTALWAGMLIPVPGPRRGFFPMGMGTLGLCLPVAIGIKAASPDQPVMIFSGDGALLYNLHELETVRKYNLDIITVVLNDSAWNMIRAGQAMTGKVYGTDLPEQDYAAVARSYGIAGRRVTRIEEVAPALQEAIGRGGSTVIDIVTDPASLPDSLISFARVEFDGAKMPAGKLLSSLWQGSFPRDVRGRNLVKFILRSR